MALGRYWAPLRVHLTGYAVAIGSVAAVTLCIGIIVPWLDVENLSLLYLIAVLLTAVTHGLGPASLASFLSVYSYNYFFIAPAFDIALSGLDDIVEMVLFFITGFVAAQLAAGQRKRAEEAEKREREARLIYYVMRLGAELGLEQAMRTIADRLRAELNLAAVVMEVEDGPHVKADVAIGDRDLVSLARAAVTDLMAREGSEGNTAKAPVSESGATPEPWTGPGPWAEQVLTDKHQIDVVPIAAQGLRLGSLALARPIAAPPLGAEAYRLIAAIATQVGALCERRRLLSERYETDVLRRADELKTALLHSVSHELRTPLASIIAASDSLLEEDVNWTEQDKREFMSTIHLAAQRLNMIVGNLLDASRIESGTLQPECDWHDLSELITDALARLASVTHKHRIRTELPDEPLFVYVDYVQIGQVVANLVENATKYSPPGSLITVRACSDNDEVAVEVLDNGHGIKDEVLPRLFEPFFRCQETANCAKGAGLGLTVAKGFVEAHNGRIWAKNRPEGGACFGFTLPRVLPVATPAQEGV